MCDVEKLLFLIKSRPAIYNAKLKAHNDKRQIGKMWSEIANELQTTVKECKIKYTSLRSSYSRFLREQPPPGSAPNPKKKSWYLAPAMTFMREHMIARKSARYSPQPEADTEQETKFSIPSPVDEFTDLTESRDYIPSSSGCTKRTHTTTDQIAEPTTRKRARYNPQPEADTEHETKFSIPSPVDEFTDLTESRDYIPSSSGCTKRTRTTNDRIAEPRTEYVNAKISRSEGEDAIYIFFKSMLPDMRKLSDKNQRRLKQDFLLNLNSLLEEQESMTPPTRIFRAT